MIAALMPYLGTVHWTKLGSVNRCVSFREYRQQVRKYSAKFCYFW